MLSHVIEKNSKKNNTKLILNKLFLSYIICFIFCFMLFIYEPIMMYATNMDSFWFDFYIMITPVLKIFLIIFLTGIMGITFVYLISTKLLKNINWYYGCLMIVSIIFFATYIQGNYLIGNLPGLDGSIIDWSIYTTENIITLGVWITIIVINAVLLKKFKLEKTIKYTVYISLAIFIMLLTSLISTMFSNDVLKNKAGIYTTYENIDVASKNKNYFIFLLDAVDADVIYNEWKNDKKYENLFNDFTFYNNALSYYPYTRDSIPLILTGNAYYNEKEFSEFYTDALNSSKLFQNLQKQQYEINIFDTGIIWNGKRNFEVNNAISSKNSYINLGSFFRQELKYVIFKYLPFNMKKISKIENLDFNYCIEKFRWNLLDNYDIIKNTNKLNLKEKNQFQFLHTEGAHVSFYVDENLNQIENGTYEQKVHANLKFIKAYLDRLKNNGVYDNSVIILMADHGYDENNILARMHPFLAIKGLNEKHDMNISDLPISYLDLEDAFLDLLNGKKSTELFKNIDEVRTRKVMWYTFNIEDHMVEYETTGKANEINKFKKTGKVYDR